MKTLRSVKIILSLCSLIILTHCNSVLEPEPKGQIALDQLITTQKGFISVLHGAYAPLASGGIYNNTLWETIEKASDDGYTWRKETDPQTYNVSPTSTSVSSIWAAHYRGIMRCNVILSHLEEAEFTNEELKNSIKGQTEFLRALYYFNLVRFYGGVPLITEEVASRDDAEKPRTSIKAVYEQIKADLNDAIKLLPDSYSGDSNLQVGMATKGAAEALQAKVYLEFDQWSDAASSAEEVINSENYSLEDNYSDNFYGRDENGKESVFEVQFTDASGGTHNGISTRVAPQTYQGGAAVLPTDNNNDHGIASTGDGIVQAFEAGDVRKKVAITSYGLPNFLNPNKPDGSIYFINKYDAHQDYQPGQSPFNFPIIRYADVLLMAAEALNEQGTGNTQAVNYVNLVRERAGLSDLDPSITGNQEKFRQAIRHERRTELCFEGNRYFDLNRWGILKKTLAEQDVTVPSDHMINHPVTGKSYFLYPLPSSEFTNNAKLGDQNPGY